MTTLNSSGLPITPANPPVRYLRMPEVLERIGVSWRTLTRWEQQELFPRRRKLGLRVVAWVEAEIDQWCAERPASSSSHGEDV
jgi:prophage regulatory protein